MQRDRDEFLVALRRVPRERLAEPSLEHGWSVKDVLSHIAWGEREAAGMLRAKALVGSPYWRLSEDERNAAVQREYRDRALAEVEGDFDRAFTELTAEIQAASEHDLNDPGRFAGLVQSIPGWRPWRVAYDPDHYSNHAQQIAR